MVVYCIYMHYIDVRDCRPIFSSKKSNQPPVTPSANKNFARSKNAMVSECFELFNSSVFDNQVCYIRRVCVCVDHCGCPVTAAGTH